MSDLSHSLSRKRVFIENNTSGLSEYDVLFLFVCQWQISLSILIMIMRVNRCKMTKFAANVRLYNPSHLALLVN